MKTNTKSKIPNLPRNFRVSANTRSLFPALLFALLAVFTVAQPMAMALTGAIFTTDPLCQVVNENVHYLTKADVYLDGGPKGIGQAGLPEGDYYVKVTTPDGTLLGTSIGGAFGDTPVHVNANGEFAECYQLLAILVKASDSLPGYDDTTNPGGEYKAWVSTVPTFKNSESKTDNFKVKQAVEPPIEPKGIIEVKKFYDANADGIFNIGDIELENWKVNINNGTTGVNRFTAVSENFPPGNYVVSEYLPIEPGWYPTTATSVSFPLVDQGVQSVIFGNLCVGHEGGGKTKGFWSNKNGQEIMNDGGSMESELELLSEKNLRNDNGNHFNPANYTQFRSWLQGAHATNMAYMLSAQYAAMILNVESGGVSAGAMIYAPGTTSANLLGFASVGAVMDEADAILGTTGTILAGNSLRTRAEAVKNALDAANNNQNFVSPEPCPYSF